MAFIDISTLVNKMIHYREKGELTPIKFGFKSFNNYDNGKYLMGSRQCTFLIGGEPHQGKSEFVNELIIQLLELHKFKIALFSTESGEVAKIFSQFCGLYQGKPFSKLNYFGQPNKWAMSDDEFNEAIHFLSDKLYIFKQDRKDSKYQQLDNIYKELARAEVDYGIKFDCLVLDPLYDVDDFEPKAESVLRVLNRINMEAEENNRLDIIVNHVSETAKVVDKKGNRKKMRALADEFYGGKNNSRKAMVQLLVNRPSPTVGMNGEWIVDPEEDTPIIPINQTDIVVLKAKPNGIGTLGDFPLYYDKHSRRYFEKVSKDGYNEEQMFAQFTKIQSRQPFKAKQVTEHRPTPQQAFKVDDDWTRE